MFRSLRFKLIAMFIVIFGVLGAVEGVIALVARERYLRNYFDRELVQHSEAMVKALLASPNRFSNEALARVIDEESKSLRFREFFVQLRDKQGMPIERSDNLGPDSLPFHEQVMTGPGAGGKVFETLSGEESAALAGQYRSLRMVSLLVNDPSVQPFYLQVATSLEHVDESLAFLRLVFIVAIAAGLLAAAVAGWIVTGRPMRQIHAVATLAHQLKPHRMAQRLKPLDTRDEVGDMVRSVNAMLDRVEAAFKAQERFIQDASHELKTPISVLLSEAQVLRLTDADKDDLKRFARSVEQEMGQMGRLIESLLVVARTDSRGVAMKGRIASVNDAVVAAVQQCNALAKTADVYLKPTLATPDENEEEMMFRGDSDLVTAMIGNLLRNAVRFSPPGQAVDLTVRRVDARAVIEVRDRGPGISPDAIQRIFDRFYQATDNGSRQGTGLGLAIARGIAELHGGTIEVRNLADGGCVFSAHLPLVASSETVGIAPEGFPH